MTTEDKLDFYHYYYPQNIKRLIESKLFTYQWEIFSECDIHIPEHLVDFSKGIVIKPGELDNPYLVDFIENTKSLGRDIVERGMYFPFIGKGLLMCPKKYILRLGKHRIFSLKKLAEDEYFDRKFLFVTTKYNMSDDKKLVKPVPLYDIERYGKIIIHNCESYIDIIHTIERCITPVVKSLYKINPHPVLNDENLFEEFMRTGKIDTDWRDNLCSEEFKN